MVITKKINFKTKGNDDIVDITKRVQSSVDDTNLSNGIAAIFVPGATGGITTIEYEEGLEKDFKDFFERAVPEDENYHHNLSHADKNGHSHVRASLLGPSLTVPFVGKKLTLGTWQQIIFVDFDNRARSRELLIQIIGE